MSKFSGKCDFYDAIEIFGIDHILGCKIYVDDSDTPLELHCLADCVPYFPHIVSMSSMNNTDKTGMIRLTGKSWVDIEEERYGEMKMHKRYRDLIQAEIAKAQKEGANYGKKE